MEKGVFVSPEGDVEKSFENIIELVKIDLIKDYFGFDGVSDDQLNDWQDKNESKLKDLFDKHPEYAGEFMVGDKKVFIEKIKEQLYQGQIAG